MARERLPGYRLRPVPRQSRLLRVICLPNQNARARAAHGTPPIFCSYPESVGVLELEQLRLGCGSVGRLCKVGGKVDNRRNRMDYCIVSEMSREAIPRFSTRLASGAFPLRHPDLSVNNMLVNDDLRITCIIDWSSASSVPLTELLAVPDMPDPQCPPEPS